jgi:hypothetical protein
MLDESENKRCVQRQTMDQSVTSPNEHPATSGRRNSPLRAAVTLTMTAAYCIVCFVHWPGNWPESVGTMAAAPRRMLRGMLGDFLSILGWSAPSSELIDGLYFLITAIVVPWVFMAVMGRPRLSDLGWRRPNRIGWRVLIVAYVLSLPFLIWMAQSPEIAGDYLPHLRRAGAFSFLSFYAVNMFSEHFLLHGVVLALLRPGWRWPAPPPLAEGGSTALNRSLRWIGLAQPVEGAARTARIRTWLGLPEACAWAIVGSAFLFALVHLGKDPREFVLSLPGGAALAYLAYRTNSMFTPLLLHLATAATACAMMIALAGPGS